MTRRPSPRPARTVPYKAVFAGVVASLASLQAAAPAITLNEWLGAALAGVIAGGGVYGLRK